MDPGTQINIPPEAYAALGTLIATNIGAVIALVKSLMGNAAEKALMNQTIQLININIAEIKADIKKNQADTNEAHAKLRELNVKWQLKNTDV